MLYLWVLPINVLNKLIAVYDRELSPDRFLFFHGIKLVPEEVSRCYCYFISTTLDLPDDPFIRKLSRENQRAYIFTPNELFYCAWGTGTKVEIDADSLQKLKAALSLTEENIDKPPKILSDQQLEKMGAIKGCPQFSRTLIFNLKVTRAEIAKYDCIPNNASSPLVNQKIVDLLLKLAPDEVQFFDADIHCKDGILTGYKLLNFTRTIKGIDHEKSVYTTMMPLDPAIRGFKYLTYKPGCMGNYKLARDEEYLGNKLATEEIKQAFEQAKIKGMRFVTPEEFYGPLRP